MKTLQEIPQELRDEITRDHVVVGAALLDNSSTLSPLASSIRENLYDCVIHILQKNTDGSIHNGDILRANFETIEHLMDDINLLEKAIQDDITRIPNLSGVFFTKAKSQFISLFD